MLRLVFLVALVIAYPAWAASKPHVIVFGKWMTVKALAGAEERDPVDLKVRPLLVDGRIREYVIENAHDVTDRLFVVRRAFRLNDLLPEDRPVPPRWTWRPGGWLLVDRQSGRVSVVNLVDFDANLSRTLWYRDYAAYCGVGEDGEKSYAVVVQLGRRKPVLRRALGGADDPETCKVGGWQRQPTRISFESKAGGKLTFAIRSNAADLMPDVDPED